MFIGRRSLRACGSVGLAAVVALGLVIVPAGPQRVASDTREVQLAAMVLSAVANSAAAAAPAGAGQQLVPAPAAIVDQQRAIIPAAAATDESSFFDTPLGTALLAVNFLLLPLWFLATPITLPLSMIAAAGQVTMDGAFGGLQFLIALGVGFITGPLGLFAPFISNSASAAAAEVPAAGRRGVAETRPAQAAAAVVADAVPAETSQAGTAEDRPPAGASRTRGRLVEREPRGLARAAAVTANQVVGANMARIEQDSAQTSDKEPVATPDVAAQSTPSSSDGAPNPKSRAKSASRR